MDLLKIIAQPIATILAAGLAAWVATSAYQRQKRHDRLAAWYEELSEAVSAATAACNAALHDLTPETAREAFRLVQAAQPLARKSALYGDKRTQVAATAWFHATLRLGQTGFTRETVSAIDEKSAGLNEFINQQFRKETKRPRLRFKARDWLKAGDGT
ncbi:MAG TPA: hypothetical protein VFS20_18550 [Longimicrobium sp.]|nr:hypothetical protein [Longimicrobium sp.]